VAPDRERERDRSNFTERICSKLKKDLDLTAEQVEQIKPIAEETSVQVKKLNAENYERVRDIVRASHQKMKPFLTPEQIQKLDDKDRERDEKARKSVGVKPPC
jgi:Spy/CpxP family protein refolding chaperone